jgi:hypothetical protein
MNNRGKEEKAYQGKQEGSQIAKVRGDLRRLTATF